MTEIKCPMSEACKKVGMDCVGRDYKTCSLYQKALKEKEQGWHARPSDLAWLKKLVDQLKIGGVWVMPAWGIVLQKLGKRKLSILKNRVPPVPSSKPICNAEEIIRRTKIVGLLIGIKVTEENG